MDQVVSEFFVNTLSMNIKPNVNKFVCCIYGTIAGSHIVGSVSELYVEPLLPCVGDLDVMVTHAKEIVVESLSSDEFNLPSFYDKVTVYKVVNTQSPSYVKLLEVGELHKFCNNKCSFVESTLHTNNYATFDFQQLLQLKQRFKRRFVDLNGPAASRSDGSAMIDGRTIKEEVVLSVQCLQWPLQAADWLVRPRKFNWPSPTTVEYIVSIGCHVVPIIRRQHHSTQLKTDVWRLSFSTAETVLLNSWTITQQIVYHMLRTVLSDEGLTEVRDNTGRRILSRYHIKTLMLWGCELKNSMWWTRINVVSLCSKFLHLLSKQCVAGYSRGYFVAEYNLFECDVTSVKLPLIAERISTLTDVNNLIKLFIGNYIGKYVQQQFPYDKQLLSDNVNTASQLHSLTAAIVGHCECSSRYKRFERCILAEMALTTVATEIEMSATSVLRVLRELRTVDENLLSCFVAYVSLRLSTTVVRTGYDDVINIVTTMLRFCSDSIGSCRVTEANSAHLYDAASLMQQIAVTHSSYTRHSLLSRCCLFFICSLNTPPSSDKRLSRMYLAILYYHLGQYKLAAEQCKSLVNAKCYRCRCNVVEGLLLPMSDRDICNVSGLVTLYHHVTTSSLSSPIRRQRVTDPLLNVFSVEVFLHFMEVKCSLEDHNTAQRPQRKPLKLYIVSDFLLYYIMLHSKCRTKNFIHDWPPVLPVKSDVSGLKSQLLSFAVENLTAYYYLLSREFSSVCTVVTTDVEAMHAYKLGFYEHCLQLSQQNVNILQSGRVRYQVMLFDVIKTLLTDNLASLTNLMQMTEYFSTQLVVVNRLTLSMLLLVLCKLELNYPMRSIVSGMLGVDSLYIRQEVDDVSDRTFLAFAYRYMLLRIRRQCVR